MLRKGEKLEKCTTISQRGRFVCTRSLRAIDGRRGRGVPRAMEVLNEDADDRPYMGSRLRGEESAIWDDRVLIVGKRTGYLALDRTRNTEIRTMVYWLGFTFCRSRAPAPAATQLHRARKWWHPALRVVAVHQHKRPIELCPVGRSAKLQKQESQQRATIAAHSARWHA